MLVGRPQVNKWTIRSRFSFLVWWLYNCKFDCTSIFIQASSHSLGMAGAQRVVIGDLGPGAWARGLGPGSEVRGLGLGGGARGCGPGAGRGKPSAHRLAALDYLFQFDCQSGRERQSEGQGKGRGKGGKGRVNSVVFSRCWARDALWALRQ